MRLARWLIGGSLIAVIAAAGTACLDDFGQCATDGDCIRFSGRCDVKQGVCIPRASTPYESTLDGVTNDNVSGEGSGLSSSSTPTEPTKQPDAAADAARDADSGGRDAGTTIRCGAETCPAVTGSVCCVTEAGPKCTTAAACAAGAPVACDDTADCAQLGFATGYICCGYNNGVGPTLLRSVCVLSAQCDANGPQDQMCDLKGPVQQCQVAMDGRTSCKAFTYTNTTDYAFCVAP